MRGRYGMAGWMGCEERVCCWDRCSAFEARDQFIVFHPTRIVVQPGWDPGSSSGVPVPGGEAQQPDHLRLIRLQTRLLREDPRRQGSVPDDQNRYRPYTSEVLEAHRRSEVGAIGTRGIQLAPNPMQIPVDPKHIGVSSYLVPMGLRVSPLPNPMGHSFDLNPMLPFDRFNLIAFKLYNDFIILASHIL